MNESLASAAANSCAPAQGFRVTLLLKVRHGRVPAHASVLAMLRPVSQSSQCRPTLCSSGPPAAAAELQR
jgi:hypothetical protein